MPDPSMPLQSIPRLWGALSAADCRAFAASQLGFARSMLRRDYAEGRVGRVRRLNRTAFFRSVAVSYLREARRLEDRA